MSSAVPRRRRARQPAVAYRVDPPSAVPAALVAPDPRSGSGPTGQRAKLFPNGRSQAVRLPKEFRLPGTEVRIWRDGKRIILEPIDEGPLDAKGWPIGFWAEIDRLRQGVDFPDPEPLGARLLTPEEIDPSIDWRR